MWVARMSEGWKTGDREGRRHNSVCFCPTLGYQPTQPSNLPVHSHSLRVKETSASGLSEGVVVHVGGTLSNPRLVFKEGYNG